jgi:hypothetical protein
VNREQQIRTDRCPLPAKLESELRTWVRDECITPEGWLFAASRGGGPIRPNYVKGDLAKLAKAAGFSASVA